MWLLRPETRAAVEHACAGVDNGVAAASDSLRALVERCLFSSRVAEQERVRELAYAAPLWGGPRSVLAAALQALTRFEKSDRDALGPGVLGTIVSWLEYDSSPSLDSENVRLCGEMCALVVDGDQWNGRIVFAAEHAHKTHRVTPVVFPSLAPPETVRLQFVDLLDLERRELAEEIVQMVWRIFTSIRATEWMSFVRRFGEGFASDVSAGATAEEVEMIDRCTSCENVLSLIQFSKSLRHWIRTTLALRKDKAKVLQFWVSIAELVLSTNAHHPTMVILEGLESALPLIGFPEGFPSSAVMAFNKLKGLCGTLPKKLEPYLAFATTSTLSNDRHPYVPALSRLTDALQSACKIDPAGGVSCSLSTVVGVVQLIQYLQQGIRHFGVAPQPLSHDMHDLLQEMPLLPEPLLVRLAEVSQRGLAEPDLSSLDADTLSSERRSSDMSMSSEAGQSTTPPLASPKSARTPSPVHGSPVGTPRSLLTTPRGVTALRSIGSDRADLGLSISYRVLSQKGATGSEQRARALKHSLIAQESGALRFEDEPPLAADGQDMMKFSVANGLIKVTWVRGLAWLARVLTGSSPIGFLPHVVDDILFSWRLIFTKPSQLMKLLVDSYPDVPSAKSSEHLNPNQVFGVDSTRSIRKRVLYVIKRLVDLERTSIVPLIDDKELLDVWNAFYAKIKGIVTVPVPFLANTIAPVPQHPQATQQAAPQVLQQDLSSQPLQPVPVATPSRKHDSVGSLPGARSISASGNLHASMSPTLSRSSSGFGMTGGAAVGHVMDEFVCVSSIQWSLYNVRSRNLIGTLAPADDFVLTAVPETVLAESMTLLEQNAFCGVSVGEILGYFRDEPVNWLRWIVDRFNHTSNWVASMVVLEDDLAKRAVFILYFMRLAVAALSIGNVSMSFAVFAGLESLPVVRMKKTWEKVADMDVKKQVTSAFETLKETFGPEGGQLGLRVHHLVNLYRVRVPFVGLWTKDVFLIDRNNETYLERATEKAPSVVVAEEANGGSGPAARAGSPVVRGNNTSESNDGGIVAPKTEMGPKDVLNVEKLSLVADSVCRVLFFQGNEMSAVPREHVVDPIGFGVALDEEGLYKVSLRREPKTEVHTNPLQHMSN